MKRFVIIMAALLISVFASAQTVEGSRTFDNIYVGVNGGVISPFMTNNGFWKDLRPIAGLEIGKDFTPVIGVSVEGIAAFNTTGSQTIVDQSNVTGNFKVNISNWFGGYKGQPRLIEFLVVPSMGWGHNYAVETPDVNYVTFNPHAQMNINMGKARAWQINVKGGVSWRTQEGTDWLYKENGAATLRVGLSYKFGHKNTKGVKTHNFTSVPVPYYSQKELDDAVIDALQKREPKVVEKEIIKEIVTERVIEKTVEVKPTLNPTFVKNMAIVDETSLSYLDALADEMKNTDKNYTLTGYASLEGSEAFNEKLSLKRAEAIKQCLVDRGVDASRLTTVAGGATDKFGSRYEQNRIVVID